MTTYRLLTTRRSIKPFPPKLTSYLKKEHNTVCSLLPWQLCKKSLTFKTLYFLTCFKTADVEENELLDYYRSVIRSVVEYACQAWSTGITKGQSDSLKQIQKRAIYITAPHLQYKEAITKFNLRTIKDHLDILNSKYFRNIVYNDSHRLHYLLPKPCAVKRKLRSTGKYELPKFRTNRFKTSFIPHALFNYQE